MGWIPFKAPAKERQNKTNKGITGSRQRSGFQQSHTCKVCGNQISSGDICPSCRAFVMKMKRKEQ